MANPIEPPPYNSGPFATRFKAKKPNPFADVRGGGSGGRGGLQGNTGFPPPAPESHLRYDLGDGQGMRDWLPKQEPARGTFSMMTAPENVNAVTGTSQMEDMERALQLANMRRANLMLQPYEPGTELPPLTIGEAVQRESAQQTLRRLDEKSQEIDAEQKRQYEQGLPAALTDEQRDDLKTTTGDNAWRAYQRALMAEQLAMGKGLPSSVFDNRNR